MEIVAREGRHVASGFPPPSASWRQSMRQAVRDPAELCRLLELDPGVPVARMLHIDWDRQGRTLQVADDLYAGDRHEFAFEWAEPDGAGPDG